MDPGRPAHPPPPTDAEPDPSHRPPAGPGDPDTPRPPLEPGEWDIPRVPLLYDRAVIASTVLSARLRAARRTGRALYGDVVVHQQAREPEQLLIPFPDADAEPRSALDMAALRALKESRTDVEALDLTADLARGRPPPRHHHPRRTRRPRRPAPPAGRGVPGRRDPLLRVHTVHRPRTVTEVVDDDSSETITEPGRPGRLVVTDLGCRLMPVIRYPTGDRGEWVDRGAGRFRLLGRSDE
ncbi:hypothetical protein [Streptomyces capitiformicae]|uniref:Uncharacterized protein n=1 Tax=Streptomyces capitiformicae TaxID=2014920 RepID=A0A919L653_9ACTN|nr:hypothetical protein [Streptomyces capitiformicae]GHH85362.1 hypothetical protein GCM10017771_18090 [Streptomyces capitiformicae]